MIPINKSKKIRFGVYVNLRNGEKKWSQYISPTISLSRNKDDFYISLRGVKLDWKISLHESGVTRLAKIADEPRLPYFKGDVEEIFDNRFVTVFRAIFIPFSDQRYLRKIDGVKKVEGALPGRGDRNSCVIFSLGYVGENAADILKKRQDSCNENIHVFKIDRRMRGYLVLTVSHYNDEEFIRMIDHFCASGLSEEFIIRIDCENFVDDIYQYRNHVNTYTYAILYGRQKSDYVISNRNLFMWDSLKSHTHF